MLASLFLLSALAIGPGQEFARHYPGSQTLAAPNGERLVHASGFAFASGARRPEEAAAAFLSLHGAAFGVTPRQALVVKGAPLAGRAGAVRLGRTIEGLPVFGGDLVLGLDAQAQVFLVNAADVPQAVSGRHALGEEVARAAALSSFRGGVRGAGPLAVAAGWRASGPVARAVYRVDFVAEEPPGDWRVFVDAETGAALFREDLRYRASAPGRAFEVSPTEMAASACPLSGAGHSLCASPAAVILPNLSTGADLSGAQASVYDCNGADHPASPSAVPGPCSPVAAASGAFDFAVDSSFLSATDDFAAAMAYYHLDRHVSFLKGLDPTLPPADATPNGSSRALRGSLPGLVNAYRAGAPMDNAFFSGLLDAMVFGQGTIADFAYDATVVYHELTHGAVFAWGGFNPDIDALGGLAEPRAVNEGTADALAAAETGRSLIASFIAARQVPAKPSLRDLGDPSASRTCQGDGTLVNQFGTTTPIFSNGLDGEVHDDGEIWGGFYWEVHQGLKVAGLKGCDGGCDAAPALQYQALQLAAGTSPTFATYWQTLKSAAAALFPSQSGAAEYVDCVARRRKLDECNRTVAVYAGEMKAQYVDQRYSPFQVVLTATAAAQFAICSARGTTTTVYARDGSPVQLSGIDPATGNATITADWSSSSLAQLCSAGWSIFTLPRAGSWHLLIDSPSAWPDAPDLYGISVSPYASASRPAPQAPPTCIPPFLAVAPTQASTPPRGSLAFTAGGGSGAGYHWSIEPNASGGSVTAAGVYTAGPTGSGASGAVTDYLRVTDSLGNGSFSVVTVTQGVAIDPATASAAPKGLLHFTAYGGSGTGFAWSLQANPSGGSIDAATGDYAAGSTADVTDVVRVSDSLGNVATASVAVAVTPPSEPKSGCGCGSGGEPIPRQALGRAALLGRWSKAAPRPPAPGPASR
jgi:Zn-dependent metalloprotease